MSMARWAQCTVLLVLVGAPLSMPGLDATSFGGWPSLGFAVALFLVAGPKRRGPVFLAETIVSTATLTWSYEVATWQGAVGSLAITLPALLTQHLLTRDRPGTLRLDDVDSWRYHVATAASAALSGALATIAALTEIGYTDSVLAGGLAAVAALTAQIAVLPLVVRTSGRRAAGTPSELVLQRLLIAVLVLVVFWPSSGLATSFLVFPALGWAAVRTTRRETHLQLFLVCLTAYVLTFFGRGPFAGELAGLPDPLDPALLYLFVAAAAYLTVPLALTVERLVSMTGRATQSATTVERLLEFAGGAVIIATDADGRITHFSAGARETLGYSIEEVLGRSPAEFHTEQQIARQARHFGVRAQHSAIVVEMIRRAERRDWQFVRKDGSFRIASLTMSHVTDADGDVVGFIGAGEDITDRVRVQKALETALQRELASVRRLEEVDHVKQELVSNVSHELRTPITSIAGYVELLADGSLGGLNQIQADAVQRIERNAGRLSLLVEDLLTLSRAESGQLELAHDQVDLRGIASVAMQTLDEQLGPRSVAVGVTLPEDPVVVLGDALALERVVLNLMGNAIKFTPDDGEVHLSVNGAAGRGTVTVCDTGVGISREDQEHLFSRFFRASSAVDQAIQGTGLGLSIVHSIVTQHGGAVSVESELGQGTCVTVLLPTPEGDSSQPLDVGTERSARRPATTWTRTGPPPGGDGPAGARFRTRARDAR